MRVIVQWTLADPTQPPVELDLTTSGRGARAWRDLAAKREPTGADTIDSTPGWVFSINVQGVIFAGFDHYGAEPIAGGGLRVYGWCDDPEDFPVGERFAEVWEFRDPAHDPRVGKVNTRQKKTIYADDVTYPLFVGQVAADGPVAVLPWAEFVPPPAALTRHGVWVRDAALYDAHLAAIPRNGWREWV